MSGIGQELTVATGTSGCAVRASQMPVTRLPVIVASSCSISAAEAVAEWNPRMSASSQARIAAASSLATVS